eukprot:6180011-Pleurochrysis_carterae.AAC.2
MPAHNPATSEPVYRRVTPPPVPFLCHAFHPRAYRRLACGRGSASHLPPRTERFAPSNRPLWHE